MKRFAGGMWALLAMMPFSAAIAESTAEHWSALGPHRVQALAGQAGKRVGFKELSMAETGLSFTNFVPENRHWTNQLLLDGGGVTAADVNGDGLVDLFFAGQGGLSSLWLNLGGWRFTNATPGAFGGDTILAGLDALGCAFADLNGDGAPDLIVNSHGQGTHLYFNDGAGHFTRYPVRLNGAHGGYTVTVADVDGDGWLDFYICNYRVHALMDMPNARAVLKKINGRTVVIAVDGRPTTEPDLTNRFVVNARGGVEELGEPDALYHNLGGTNFVEVPWTEGAFLDEAGNPLRRPPYDWGLSAMFRDLNGDGRPELYVCNDFQSPDRLWMNQSAPGLIRFRAAGRSALRHTSFFSMGVDFADINRDGNDDFIVLDMLSRNHRQRMTQLSPPPPEGLDASDPEAVMQYPANTVQLGRGDGTFAEVAAFAGLQATEWSWTPAFLDVDLDGWEDLLVTNGQWRASRDLDVVGDLQRLRRQRKPSDAEIFEARKAFPRLEPPKLAFRNDGRGRFTEVGGAWGFATPAVAQGMCLADLDGDGDLDVIVNRLNGPALLYRNETTAPRVAVRLHSEGPNRFGIGARIKVLATADSRLPEQTQEIIAGGRYLSGDTPERVFATGRADSLEITVNWPDGRTSKIADAHPNHRYELHPEAAGIRVLPKPGVTPWFEDRSAQLLHTNRNEPYDEFARQPLLPRRLFTEGPGVTWADLNRDGREELVVGAGHHGTMTIFSPDASGVMHEWTNVAGQNLQTALLPWDGGLLVGESTYAEVGAIGHAIFTWPGIGPQLSAQEEALGPLAAADVDADGRLEIFAGGRVIPGAWPRSANSRLLKPNGNGFETLQKFEALGLVEGAVFTDFDLDGHPDLAVACEWNSLRLFLNRSNRLSSWDPPVDIAGRRQLLSQLTGRWTSVQSGDFDGDGRPDLVAGNWGENDYYALYGSRLAAFHGEMPGSGNYQVIEAYDPRNGSDLDHRDATTFLPIHGLPVLGQQLPWLAERYSSHRAFSDASVGDMLGGLTQSVAKVETGFQSSVVLLNRGDHFELRRLPDPVQWSPVWGITVADWDGDGHEDLFIAQNYFGHNHGIPRDDAGLGIVLRGDGKGGFTPLTAQVSGVRIEGEARGAATADFDGDGRPDLAVSQHDGPTKLYRNTLGRPGLRIRLVGPAGNSLAAGASLRLAQGGYLGPAREIRLGGGHWSSDAATTILARPLDGAAEVMVRWPGGNQTRTHVAASLQSVLVHPDGTASELR